MASEQLGSRVDILVNNAGIPRSAVSITPFLDIAREDWAPYIDLNLLRLDALHQGGGAGHGGAEVGGGLCRSPRAPGASV